MPVTSSSFAFDGPAQRDGFRWVRERHLVTGGEVEEAFYLASPETNVQTVMAERVARLNEALAEREALANFERDGALTLLHQTGAQFAARMRQEIRDATRERSCYLAWWLLRRIAANHITNAQCQTAFGMTATQWTTAKTNTVTPRSNAWATILAAGGM